MSPLTPPPIDPRSHEDFVARTEALLERYTGGWRPAEGDPAAALVRVFARMAGHVADRLNRIPDRSFLAFLELVGVEPRPPQPARVPLTFSLAAGAAADAVVPARTPVAGQPLEGETEAAVFETERELVVTRTVLDAVVVHDPAHDRWADRTADAAAGTAFAALAGDTPLAHRLHLSHPHAFGAGAPKTVRLRLETDTAGAARWPEIAEWSWRDAAGEHPLPAPAVEYGADWQLSFAGLPAVPPSAVAGMMGTWISARLRAPLRVRGAAPETVVAGGAWMEPGATFFPFGRTEPGEDFHLSAPEIFSVPGALATIEVVLDDDVPAPAADTSLRVRWEYWNGTGWEMLGESSPGAAGLAGSIDPFAFSDGTRALTRSGAVAFRVPADWAEIEIAGRGARWLRARVEAGGYEDAGGFLPPAVRRLALGYDLPVPPVTAAQARVEAAEAGLLPAAGYAGATGLDLSTVFLPFGERPAPGGLFYLALPQLLGKAGAKVALRLTLEPFPADTPAAGPRPTLRWEFWDAPTGRWRPFGESAATAPADFGYGFRDDTASLTRVGTPARVDFIAPDLGEVEVNGRRDAWIRVRIAAGDYGRDARYVGDTARDAQGNALRDAAGNPIVIHRLVPPTYRPPTVREVSLDYAYASGWTAPDAAVSENGWSFAPLVPAAGALPSFIPFTLPSDLRPALYLGFRRPGEAVGFANRAATLYLGVSDVPFGEGDGEMTAEPASLAWEYWDGARWARLEVRDETAALTRRGMVTFVGPADFRASRRFGREAFWLRAVADGGGWPRPPRLERVLLNTVWAEHAARVAGEVLGSGTGRPGQSVHLARVPVLPGERIEVREAGLPSAAEIEALEREGGPGAVALPAGGGEAGEAWVRWTRVPDFHGSGPASRHYVVDRATGEVRFGDGVHGRVPPRGRANLRAALYRTGGGPAGNRPAGNLVRLRAPVPSVDRVTNLEPAAGGAPAEPLESVRVRGPRTLRHRDRAVTLADLEDLAVEASPEVAVARAAGPASEKEAGRVRVVVVPRAAAARPVPSLELLDRVRAYLGERLPATVELEVRGPEWMEVAVTVEVVAATPEAAGAVQAALSARLAAYLHPLTGGPGGGGWPFGRRPWRSDLYAVAEATPGVDHVRLLELRETRVPRTPFFLVHSGAHVVRVAGAAAE